MYSSSAASAVVLNMDTSRISTSSRAVRFLALKCVMAASLSDDGDGKDYICRLHVLAVRRVAGYLGKVGQRKILCRADLGERILGNAHLTRALCDAGVDFERNRLAAGEAVIAADLVRAVRHGERRHLHRAGLGIVCDLGIVRCDDRAVGNVDRQRGRHGDIDRPVLIVHGQRDRHGRRGRTCGKGAYAERECQKHCQQQCRDSVSFHKSSFLRRAVFAARRVYFCRNYATVSHSITNTTFATVAFFIVLESGVTMAA